mmetsp:Transcript_51322/g.92526  ORF Transcript_51322/g.92526 Transcript_51322/m.92526 type:complete len:325 (+) Transcript_51322:86-1060(+)
MHRVTHSHHVAFILFALRAELGYLDRDIGDTGHIERSISRLISLQAEPEDDCALLKRTFEEFIKSIEDKIEDGNKKATELVKRKEEYLTARGNLVEKRERVAGRAREKEEKAISELSSNRINGCEQIKKDAEQEIMEMKKAISKAGEDKREIQEGLLLEKCENLYKQNIHSEAFRIKNGDFTQIKEKIRCLWRGCPPGQYQDYSERCGAWEYKDWRESTTVPGLQEYRPFDHQDICPRSDEEDEPAIKQEEGESDEDYEQRKFVLELDKPPAKKEKGRSDEENCQCRPGLLRRMQTILSTFQTVLSEIATDKQGDKYFCPLAAK